MTQDTLKRCVARAAALFVEKYLGTNDLLGVGTGSTVNHFIEAIADANVFVRGAVSSSNATTDLLRAAGIEILDPDVGDRLALYVDGADEVDPHGCMIKGGGGALTQEKIVAAMSTNFLCLVDASKLVDRLGAFPVPVEVIPMAQTLVSKSLAELGGEAVLRRDFVSDNGNVILDVHGLQISEPMELETHISCIPGVVENGIFSRYVPFLTFVGRSDSEVEARGSQTELEAHATTLQNIGVQPALVI